ncbi:MAG: flagellar protein FlgN [Gallionella sp.]
MSHPACPELLKALSEELLAVRSFVELLQQEQELLTENSIDQLLVVAEKKSARAIALNDLAEICRRLLEQSAPSADNAIIQSWFETNCREGLPLWQEIRALANQSRQLNQINGELIQMKLRHNQQTLTALTRAVSQANLYGRDGQTNFSAGSGRSLGSV